jgi:hypothetical protein
MWKHLVSVKPLNVDFTRNIKITNILSLNFTEFYSRRKDCSKEKRSTNQKQILPLEYENKFLFTRARQAIEVGEIANYFADQV